MAFPFEHLRDVFHREILGALQGAEKEIRKLAESERFGPLCAITGISFDLLPWHGYAAISLRSGDDDRRYAESPADWKYSAFLEDEPFESTTGLIQTVYEKPEPGFSQAEAAHLIFLAAAEALLAPEITLFLRQCRIDAPLVSNQLPTEVRFYVVVDNDRVFNANYCEFVAASRLNRRLLGE